MMNPDKNQIRDRTKSDIDFAVMMMMGTDLDPDSTAEERELQKDLLWIQSSQDRTEFLTRGRTVKNKWEQVIANDPDYSQGHLPSWQNPWMEFKLAFLLESDDPQDEKEVRALLRPDESYDEGEIIMPNKNPQITNEDILKKPRSEWTEPYYWRHPDVLNNPEQYPNLIPTLQNAANGLSAHPEYRNDFYSWDLKPLYEFSQSNPNNPAGNMAQKLKDLPEHLQPIGFEREDLPENQFRVSAECHRGILQKTYTYSDQEIAQNGIPTDTQLAARLLEDYTTDKLLTHGRELQEDLQTAETLKEKLETNGWKPIEVENGGHSMTIEPCYYGSGRPKLEQIEFFLEESNEMVLSGDFNLIGVAHTLNNLPEKVAQDAQEKKDFEQFSRDHIYGYTAQQWDLTYKVSRSVDKYWMQHSDINYEEHAKQALPIVANEFHIPTKVAEAALQLKEHESIFRDWHKDLYGYRPETDEAYHTSQTERKPFAGIKTADYETEWKKETLPGLTRPSEVRTPGTSGFMRDVREGWKDLKAATIEGDGFKVEFSRYADRTIDPMCDALNGWYYSWRNDFECKYTDAQGELTLRTYKPEEADRLFDIMTNIEPVTFEHEGSLTAAEVARAGMEALIVFTHPEQTQQIRPAKTNEPAPTETKDFEQLKPGEYEIIHDKKGNPYIHGKADFKGAPAEVYFKQTYGTHELTDMETKSLLKGNEISIPVRSGNASVKLGEGKVNGHAYFGLQRTDIQAQSRRLPDTPETSATVEKQAGQD